jgi:hypothetical protein
MTVRELLCSGKELRPTLRAVPGGGARGAEASRFRPEPVAPHVVAEVLSDGTIRRAGEPARPPGSEFETGQVSGDGWILWWEMRRLD